MCVEQFGNTSVAAPRLSSIKKELYLYYKVGEFPNFISKVGVNFDLIRQDNLKYKLCILTCIVKCNKNLPPGVGL